MIRADLVNSNEDKLFRPTLVRPATSEERSPPTPTFPSDERVLSAARRAAALGLCPECFGRVFGQWGHGLSNPERAERLRGHLGTEPAPATEPCPLCRGLFARLDVWAERAQNAVATFEWHRFACGSRWEPEILAREEAVWLEVGSEWGESARGAFNRELGKRIESRTGTEGSPDDPEIMILADLPAGRVETTILPVYFRGRYRKLDRTIPQTHWPCRRCSGRGCDTCGGTGKTYPTSVEELIGQPVVELLDGAGTRFHGMGREDIDARMLGSGRPFVLEVLRPHRRSVDLAELRERIARNASGRVEVVEIAPTEALEVVRVKEANPEKSYRVGVGGAVGEAKINEVLRMVEGRAIAQRTPTRVVHRRSDLVRERRIVSARLVTAEEGRFTLDIRTEAGTYVKEWVEGDGGRTQPNLSELLGTPLHVEFLDVLEIHDER